MYTYMHAFASVWSSLRPEASQQGNLFIEKHAFLALQQRNCSMTIILVI